MRASHGPSVGRLRLRSALRRARESADLTQEQVAAAMEWSLSKVIRIEAGSVSVSLNDLKALIGLYDITAPDEIEELKELARSARRRGWLTEYRDRFGPQFAAYLGLESEAHAIRYFHPGIVPGPLRTRDFARLVIEGSRPYHQGDQDSEVLTDLLMRRQAEVLHRADPPRIDVILDESAVRRPIGDRPLMRRQWAHVIKLAESPLVEVQVIPFSAGIYPAMMTPFVILEFPEDNDHPVVFLENPFGGTVIDRIEDVEQYLRTYRRLGEIALTESDSMELIRKIAAQFD